MPIKFLVVTTLLLLFWINMAATHRALAEQSDNNTMVSSNSTVANRSNEAQLIAWSLSLKSLRESAAASYQNLQFATAVEKYNRICQLNRASATDYYWLAESYYHMNSFAHAAASFEHAISLPGATEEAWVRLVESYIAARQPGQARLRCAYALSAVQAADVKTRLRMMEKVLSRGTPPLVVRNSSLDGAVRKNGVEK